MEQLKMIKEQLIAQVQSQMADLKCVDTKELGEVVDMIKDLAQAQYYCKVYEAMEEKGFSRRTVERAKSNLSIKSRKQGQHWIWTLDQEKKCKEQRFQMPLIVWMKLSI